MILAGTRDARLRSRSTRSTGAGDLLVAEHVAPRDLALAGPRDADDRLRRDDARPLRSSWRWRRLELAPVALDGEPLRRLAPLRLAPRDRSRPAARRAPVRARGPGLGRRPLARRRGPARHGRMAPAPRRRSRRPTRLGAATRSPRAAPSASPARLSSPSSGPATPPARSSARPTSRASAGEPEVRVRRLLNAVRSHLRRADLTAAGTILTRSSATRSPGERQARPAGPPPRGRSSSRRAATTRRRARPSRRRSRPRARPGTPTPSSAPRPSARGSSSSAPDRASDPIRPVTFLVASNPRGEHGRS